MSQRLPVFFCQSQFLVDDRCITNHDVFRGKHVQNELREVLPFARLKYVASLRFRHFPNIQSYSIVEAIRSVSNRLIGYCVPDLREACG